jgi:hypothetical protein
MDGGEAAGKGLTLGRTLVHPSSCEHNEVAEGGSLLGGATVHLLWAFIGALLVLLIVKLLGRANFRRP